MTTAGLTEQNTMGLQLKADKKYYVLFIDYTTNVDYLSGTRYKNYKTNTNYFLIDKSTINNPIELKTKIKELLGELFKKGEMFRFDKVQLKKDISSLKTTLKKLDAGASGEKITTYRRLKQLQAKLNKQMNFDSISVDERIKKINDLVTAITLSEYKIMENPKWQQGRIENAKEYKTNDLIDQDKSGKYEKIKINVIIQLKTEKKNKRAIFVHVHSNIAPYVDMVLYNSGVKGGRDFFVIELETKRLSKENRKKNIIKQIELLLESKLGNKHFYYKIKEGNEFYTYVIDNYSWNKKYFNSGLQTSDIYDQGNSDESLKYDVHVNVNINRKDAGYQDRLRMNCRYHRNAVRNIVDELFNGSKLHKSDEDGDDGMDDVEKMRVTTENVQEVIDAILKGESRQALEDDADAREEGRAITKYKLPTSFPNYVHPNNGVRLFVMRDQLKLYNTYFTDKRMRLMKEKEEQQKEMKRQKTEARRKTEEKMRKWALRQSKKNQKYINKGKKLTEKQNRTRKKRKISDASRLTSLPR